MRRQILLRLCFWLWIIILVFMTWSSFCKYFVTFFIHIRIVLFFISCQIVCKWKTPAFLWVAWLQHFAMFCLLVQMNLWIFLNFFLYKNGFFLTPGITSITVLYRFNDLLICVYRWQHVIFGHVYSFSMPQVWNTPF